MYSFSVLNILTNLMKHPHVFNFMSTKTSNQTTWNIYCCVMAVLQIDAYNASLWCNANDRNLSEQGNTLKARQAYNN